MRPSQRSSLDRWILFITTSVVLSGLTWFYVGLIRFTPSHRTYGAFVISGQAANQHADPFAIRPGIWVSHPYRNETGPAIYDRNLQPPAILPLFQLFTKVNIITGLKIWMWGSALIFMAGTAALMLCFPETVRVPLILLLLLSEATLNTLSVGEDFALLFAFAVAAVCLLRFDRNMAAAICIGILAALHPNFGLWPVLLFATGHRRMALTSGATAVTLTVLPAVIYGPSIYAQLARAIASDNHSYVMEDISLIGFFTRAGHRTAGIALSAIALVVLYLAMRRRRATPTTVGGIAACAALLFSPLAWVGYLLVAFPCLAERRLDRFAACAVALMFIWDRAWQFTGHGFLGLCGCAQFLAAAVLFFVSFSLPAINSPSQEDLSFFPSSRG